MATNPDEKILTEVSDQILKTGHEPDEFSVKGILVIPLAVIVFFVVGFGATTLVFDYFKEEAAVPDPNAHPEATARYTETDLNDRMSRLGIDNEIPQARLEGLRTRENPLMTSSQELSEGNSMEFHPEDMRPSSAYGKKLGLQDYGVVKKADKKEESLVRIPINNAIDLLVKQGKLKVIDKPVDPDSLPSQQRPRSANAGQPPVGAKKEEHR